MKMRMKSCQNRSSCWANWIIWKQEVDWVGSGSPGGGLPGRWVPPPTRSRSSHHLRPASRLQEIRLLEKQEGELQNPVLSTGSRKKVSGFLSRPERSSREARCLTHLTSRSRSLEEENREELMDHQNRTQNALLRWDRPISARSAHVDLLWSDSESESESESWSGSGSGSKACFLFSSSETREET